MAPGRIRRPSAQRSSAGRARRKTEPCRSSYVNAETLAEYEGVDLASDDALQVHKKNFHLKASEISHATVRRRRTRRTGRVPNSGLVTIHPLQGRPKKYVLIGKQDPELLTRLLQDAGIRVEQA